MLVMKPLYELAGEIKPDISERNVWAYVQEKFENKEGFNILIVKEWEETHVVMDNLYSIGDYAVEGSAVIQEETAVVCFQTHKLYLKMDNQYPIPEHYDMVAPIYTLKQMEDRGFEIEEELPTSHPTPYADA